MAPVQSTTSLVPAEGMCPRCGAPIGGFGPEGLCGHCLFTSGLAESEGLEGAPVATAPPGVGGGRVGDYELLGEIARGGMGVVYRARQVSLNRIVAVKMTLRGSQSAPDELARFRLEAEAAARLNHPNIVAIHEVGEHEGQHYFSMEFVEGRSLSALVRDGPLPAAMAARYVEKIARAVHYAHEQGVLHRDLKPSNVLVDADDEPLVTDFGLAKRLDNAPTETSRTELTLSGQIVGTPSFMPPEQASAARERVGPPSDVYALGAILYYLLAGRPPFVGPDVQAVIGQVLRDEVVALRLLNPAVPRDLEIIALQCLEKEPSRRYASALALAEDLVRHLNHEAIRAAPPSALYRAGRFVRRHRAAVAVAACFAAVLLTATGVSVRFAVRADQERRSALKAKGETEQANRQALGSAHAARVSETNSQHLLKFFSLRILAAAKSVDAGGLGRTVTVREAVAAAERDIGRAFANNPLAEAAARGTLGQAYLDLGETSNAVRQLELAVTLFRSVGGPRHNETLATMDTLGLAYEDQGRFDEALALHERVMATLTERHGWGHSNTVTAAHNVAAAYRNLGRYAEAVDLLERVVAWRRANLGVEHVMTLNSLSTLAGVYLQRRETAKAIRLLEECYAVERRSADTNDLGILATMGLLANAYHEDGRPEVVLPLRRENLRRREVIQGPEHRDTLSARHNLAQSCRAAGLLDEAISLHESTLDLRRKILGPDHPHTLASLLGLARAYEEAGRFEAAVAVSEEAAPLHERRLGREHPDTLSALNALAMLYLDGARLPEALELAETVVRRARRGSMAGHPDTVVWMQNLARVYKASGRLTKAIPLFEECLGMFATNSATRIVDRLTCMHNLAGAHGLTGDWPRAVALFEETVKLKAAALGDNHRHTLASVRELAYACQAAGQLERAETAFEDLLRARRATLPGNHPNLSETLAALGELRLRQEKEKDAEAPLREALAILEKQSPGRSRTAVVRSLLGAALAGQKRFADARDFLVPAAEELERAANPLSQSRTQLFNSAVERVIRLYEDWGKPDEAAIWREKLSKAGRGVPSPL